MWIPNKTVGSFRRNNLAVLSLIRAKQTIQHVFIASIALVIVLYQKRFSCEINDFTCNPPEPNLVFLYPLIYFFFFFFICHQQKWLKTIHTRMETPRKLLSVYGHPSDICLQDLTKGLSALEHFWLWDWLNLFMAACLRVPKVSELHGALRRELVWHVVCVPRHPTAVYGTKLVWEIENTVIPIRASGVCLWTWVRVSINVGLQRRVLMW